MTLEKYMKMVSECGEEKCKKLIVKIEHFDDLHSLLKHDSEVLQFVKHKYEHY